jgi:hypothetical protein
MFGAARRCATLAADMTRFRVVAIAYAFSAMCGQVCLVDLAMAMEQLMPPAQAEAMTPSGEPMSRDVVNCPWENTGASAGSNGCQSGECVVPPAPDTPCLTAAAYLAPPPILPPMESPLEHTEAIFSISYPASTDLPRPTLLSTVVLRR